MCVEVKKGEMGIVASTGILLHVCLQRCRPGFCLWYISSVGRHVFGVGCGKNRKIPHVCAVINLQAHDHRLLSKYVSLFISIKQYSWASLIG